MSAQSKSKKARPYHSPLRESQMEQTRQRLVEAAGELLAAGEMPELSLPMIAKHANISVPTAYRHFPTREALVAEVSHYVQEKLKVRTAPREARELPAYARDLYRAFDDNADLMRGRLTTPIGREIHSTNQPERARAVLRALGAALPELDPRELKQVAGIFRVLLSSGAWQQMREAYGLTAAESGPAVDWALRTLLRELSRHPHALREEP
jgi:AcrR family transcriptional regulator